jgi:hypothetical protein
LKSEEGGRDYEKQKKQEFHEMNLLIVAENLVMQVSFFAVMFGEAAFKRKD